MRSVILTAATILAALSTPALAENGGDRAAAGGAFMSSYAQGSSSSSVRGGEPSSSLGLAAGDGRDVSATGSIAPRAPRRTR